jgi:hypothetical protein
MIYLVMLHSDIEQALHHTMPTIEQNIGAAKLKQDA